MASIETLSALDGGQATPEQQAVLARWGSWGAIPAVFDESNTDWAEQRARLRSLLDGPAWDAARRTTINAHYTDPAYVAEMWHALGDLGFTGGNVLEAGCGAGTFIGLAPKSARMIGVELDPTTAAIASALYPQAQIRSESFAETRLARDSFDATVGNVPFADVRLHDAAFNSGNFSMHNHFIVKSLALTRPGGMVAVLTSSFTLDAANPAARRAMDELGDLVGAVRLPTGAHRRAAGTEALTDLVVIRRREPGAEPADQTWETLVPVEVDGQTVNINAYFAAHPDRMLGQLYVGHGMYGEQTTQVRAADLAATPGRLHEALDGIVAEARATGLTMTARAPQTGGQPEHRAAPERAATDLWDGTIVAASYGFAVAEHGVLRDLNVPATQRAEVRVLLRLRDGARALLETEAINGQDTDELAVARRELRTGYDRYVARYGPINRYTLRRTGRVEPEIDQDTGEPVLDEVGRAVMREKMARVAPRPVALLRQDPYGALVRALEVFDDETQRAAPAQLLEQRVLAPRTIPDGADTPADALAMTMDATGRADLPTIAHLLGVDEETARAQLGTLVFDEPGTDTLIPAPEYLSGNVRIKLDAAVAAATDDPRYTPNIAALEAVMPPTIDAADIEAQLGAVWISPEIHQQFLREILQDRGITVENPLPGHWTVHGGRAGVLSTSEWGTERRPAPTLAEALMNQAPVLVKDNYKDADGRTRSVANPVETEAATAKSEALQERFGAWVWKQPARAAALVEEYNRRFNSIVLRDYASAGETLSLPGLAETITLRPHQRAAVARMISEPAVGLFHETGAGKTYEMVTGVSELRRLGMVRKPMVIVPNHMLEQWSREWLQAYPAARILAASSADIAGDKRRVFTARAAANEWDGIIMTHSAFKKISMDPHFEAEYIAEQAADLREALEHAKAAGLSKSGVKMIEKAVMKGEERQKKLLDTPRDPGLTFGDLGVDYICVDEAHLFKNLGTTSDIRDASITGSEHATDLHMKLEFLRRRYGRRVATLATATPLSNSITEAHVMCRYLRPDLLDAAGVKSFAAWAATFGQQVNEPEVGPAGDFRFKTRFARFQNVPEMLRMWHVFADVKTAEDLHLPVPAITQRSSDGARAPEIVAIEPTPELSGYIEHIVERAEKVASHAVDMSQDNMLLISTDGRKAAVDLRMIDADVEQTAPVKLDAVTDRIVTEWTATCGNVYTDGTGQPSPTTGGLQLVFCDMSTPDASHPDKWNAYDELRSKLVDRGMPYGSIRFMHDARTDQDKARLFTAARAGHVAVLIGSTAKMGIGTNVQTRITALHHVDCPWRPSDIQQRDGRGIRQGNQNAEVGMFRYVVRRSFDGYMWQTNERKSMFTGQIMRGSLDAREVEDIGADTLSAGAAKAVGTGNPLLLEKANADNTLAKLKRRQTAHQRAQAALRHTRTRAEQKIDVLTETLAGLRAAAPRTRDISGEKFRMEIDGRAYTERGKATDALATWAQTHTSQWIRPGPFGAPVPFAKLGGHTVTAGAERQAITGETLAVLTLDGVPLSTSRLHRTEFEYASQGLIRQLENKTTAINGHIGETETDLAKARRTLTEAEDRIGTPFPQADELAAAHEAADDVARRIAEQARPNVDPEAASAEQGGPALDEQSREARDPARLRREVLATETIRQYPAPASLDGAAGRPADDSATNVRLGRAVTRPSAQHAALRSSTVTEQTATSPIAPTQAAANSADSQAVDLPGRLSGLRQQLGITNPEGAAEHNTHGDLSERLHQVRQILADRAAPAVNVTETDARTNYPHVDGPAPGTGPTIG